jgi:hypothetical protein
MILVDYALDLYSVDHPDSTHPEIRALKKAMRENETRKDLYRSQKVTKLHLNCDIVSGILKSVVRFHKTNECIAQLQPHQKDLENLDTTML